MPPTTSPSHLAGRRSWGTGLAAVQAAYYALTGVAPLVTMRGFERITGPKVDDWLVRTVGLLALSFSVVLGRDAVRRRPDPLVGIAGAVPFALASGWYGGTGRISRVYLLDAAVEAVFVIAWLALRRGDRKG